MKAFSKLCRATLGASCLVPALAASVQAQGKLPVPGRGGDGIYEIAAPAEPMTAEGHAGTGAGAVAPTFAEHPAACVIRALKQDGASRLGARVLRGGDLLNLALGRPPGTPLDGTRRLVLQIGDDTPATARLVALDPRGTNAPIVIATGQMTEPIQDRVRKRGLLKLQFQAVGSLRGGSVQLVTHTAGAGSAKAILASGNGQLESSHEGFSETLLVTSIVLRAGVGATVLR